MKNLFILPVDKNWATALVEQAEANMPVDCFYFKSQAGDKPIVRYKTYKAICGGNYCKQFTANHVGNTQ